MHSGIFSEELLESRFLLHGICLRPSRLLKKSPSTSLEGGYVAAVDGEFAGEVSIVVEFGRAAAGGFVHLVVTGPGRIDAVGHVFAIDRKSTRLNSSH